jgi:hypothetical protein
MMHPSSGIPAISAIALVCSVSFMFAFRAQDFEGSANRDRAMMAAGINIDNENCATRVEAFVVDLDEIWLAIPETYHR